MDGYFPSPAVSLMIHVIIPDTDICEWLTLTFVNERRMAQIISYKQAASHLVAISYTCPDDHVPCLLKSRLKIQIHNYWKNSWTKVICNIYTSAII